MSSGLFKKGWKRPPHIHRLFRRIFLARRAGHVMIFLRLDWPKWPKLRWMYSTTGRGLGRWQPRISTYDLKGLKSSKVSPLTSKTPGPEVWDNRLCFRRLPEVSVVTALLHFRKHIFVTTFDLSKAFWRAAIIRLPKPSTSSLFASSLFDDIKVRYRSRCWPIIFLRSQGP